MTFFMTEIGIKLKVDRLDKGRLLKSPIIDIFARLYMNSIPFIQLEGWVGGSSRHVSYEGLYRDLIDLRNFSHQGQANNYHFAIRVYDFDSISIKASRD